MQEEIRAAQEELQSSNEELRSTLEERKRAEQEVREARIYAESIVERLHEPLVVLHPDLTVKSANPAFYEQFQVQPKETVGRRVYELGNGQWNIPALRTLLEDVLPDSNAFNDYEVIHDFEDIGQRVMLLNARRLDHVQLILLGIRDITERKRAELGVRESEEKYRELFERIDEGFCVFEMIYDENGRAVDYRFVEVNPAFERQTGLADAVGKTIREMVPNHEQHWFEKYGRVAETGESHRFEDRAEGLGRWYDVYAFRTGEPGRRTVAALFSDISERKQTESTLRESEQRFRLFGEASSNVLWIRDAERLQWEYLSPAFEAIYGYARSQIMGRDDLRHWAELIAPEDREQALAALNGVRGGERAVFEFRIRRADGQIRWLRTTAFPINDEHGRVRRIGGIGHDITEQKDAEAALREWSETLEQRVEARTAALVQAHEARRQALQELVTAEEEERRRISRELHDHFGQQLTGLQLGLHAIESETAATERLRGLQRLADEVARDLQRLAVELRPQALDLGLATALRSFVSEWSARHGVEADFHDAGIDSAQLPRETEMTLYRVVQEGLNNVLKHAKARHVSVLLERRDETVRLIVEDDGVGFDAERVLASPEKAQRLGVRGMRERLGLLGGELGIESSAGRGTTLYVRLPDARRVPGASSDEEGSFT